MLSGASEGGRQTGGEGYLYVGSRTATRAKPAWEDRFNVPTQETLRAGLSKPHGTLLDHALDSLLEISGVSCTIAWRGVPWRWTLCFRARSVATEGIAYLVPQPGKPLLSVPLPEALVRKLPVKTSRTIRDAIAFAPLVAGEYWAHWELGTKSQIDEVIEIVLARMQIGTKAS
jgi:hypothetical protein